MIWKIVKKWYGKYGRKASWNVKRYGKYGRKASWIVKRYENMEESKLKVDMDNMEKIWKDMKNMEESQVEKWKDIEIWKKGQLNCEKT